MVISYKLYTYIYTQNGNNNSNIAVTIVTHVTLLHYYY